eukprot:TRINITY_DN4790_c0_g1_i3.p1 TRINITY_DN4790_c0_g1~~TRINITY_DN4790_c0_g1_i3.p1  ORF type:complete len:528 (+),score=188.66 TRINITY_DN4790_c0_g1_i3:206-1789(+)
MSKNDSGVDLRIEGVGNGIIPSSVLLNLQRNSNFAAFAVLQTIDKVSSSLVSSTFLVGGYVVGLSLADSDGNVIQVKDSDLISIIIRTSTKRDSSTTCSFWNENTNNWASDGCSIGDKSTDYSIECLCNHLTNFTVGRTQLSAANTAAPKSTLINGLADGALIGIIVGVCVLIMIVIVVVFLIIRRKNAKKQNRDQLEMVQEVNIESGIAGMDLELKQEIGKGAFGKVFLAIQGGTTALAVKVYDQGYDKKLFVYEIGIMNRLHHPNVIQFLGSMKGESGNYQLIMEYVSEGTLLDSLRSDKSKMDNREKIGIANGVAAALNYLKECNICHNDVSSRNVLMRQDRAPKLIDFGMAFDTQHPLIPSNEPPTRWSAPEVLSKREYSHASDVWSFGILLFEIHTNGTVPYSDKDNKEVVSFVTKGNKLKIPEGVTLEISALMEKCWSSSPNDRPEFSQIAKALKKELKNHTEKDGPIPIEALSKLTDPSRRSAAVSYDQEGYEGSPTSVKYETVYEQNSGQSSGIESYQP